MAIWDKTINENNSAALLGKHETVQLLEITPEGIVKVKLGSELPMLRGEREDLSPIVELDLSAACLETKSRAPGCTQGHETIHQILKLLYMRK